MVEILVTAHKNVKLFVMQGGIQSLEETISRGVPVVAIPFFSDQEANADKICELRIGQRLNIGDLTQDTLTAKIKEVIEDPSYQERSKQLGDQIKDTPMPPVETAVWWIEYAIRNRGAKHLKYKGAEMSFFDYFLVDVILFHAVLGISVVLALVKFLKMYRNRTCQDQKESFRQVRGKKLK